MKKKKLIDLIIEYFLSGIAILALLTYYFYEITDLEFKPVIMVLISFPIFIGTYFGMQTNQFKLPRKGLTDEDLININFVKNWEETKKEGMPRFIIFDGVIIFGTLLSAYLCIMLFCIWGDQFLTHLSSPSAMFKLIAKSYLSGAIIGVICYRILWFYNQRRFDRLTNPID